MTEKISPLKIPPNTNLSTNTFREEGRLNNNTPVRISGKAKRRRSYPGPEGSLGR
jgi:hypothetical protein